MNTILQVEACATFVEKIFKKLETYKIIVRDISSSKYLMTRFGSVNK